MLQWKIKQHHLGHRNIFIGLFLETEQTKKWVYLFKFIDQLPKKVNDIDHIFELNEEIIQFFNSMEELDVNQSADKFQNQRNKDVQYLNLNKVTLLTYIKEDIKNFLLNIVSKKDPLGENEIVELLLISRFLGSAKLLAEPSIVQGLSKKEQIDIKLRCFTYRLQCYDLLINSNYFPNDYKEKLLTVYYNEMENFVTFLQENSFNSYLLSEDLQDFLLHVRDLKNKNKISIDHVINYVSNLFYKTLKKENENPELEIPGKKEIRELRSRFVRFFHLQRFAVLDSMKQCFGLPWMDKFNVFLPRFAAAIIIGMIPVFVTDEINQWAYREMQLLPLSGFESGMKLAAPIFLLGLCWFYLSIEVRNFLGYLNFRKSSFLFFIGLVYSFIISFFMHYTFTATFNLEMASELQQLFYIWGRPIFLELYLIQVSVSFFLGLVLQTIWEDKPISHPL